MAGAQPVWFLATAAGILGAIWGSFVAALCSRWPEGESILRGRSRCDHCRQTLAARDLVPIISFLLLRGKCRHCDQQLGRDMIAIELLCAAIGSGAFLLLAPAQAFALALFGWLLVPLAILDFRHLWLPDRLALPLAAIGLLLAPALDGAVTMTDRLIGGAAGFAVLEVIRRLYRATRQREGMGAGDPKLLGALGLWLGWQALPLTLLVASGIGIVFAIAARGRVNRALPFGTFLAFAGFAVACAMAGTNLA